MQQKGHMIKNIIKFIHGASNEDVDLIVQAIKYRRNQLHTQKAHQFRFGDRVYFTGRHGITLHGTVEKVKIKYVLVRTDSGQRWNIPGSHLNKEKETA